MYFFTNRTLLLVKLIFGDEDARRLIEDLLIDYDTVVRPVVNQEDQIKLYLGIKLSQIADIVNY